MVFNRLFSEEEIKQILGTHVNMEMVKQSMLFYFDTEMSLVFWCSKSVVIYLLCFVSDH